MPASRIGGALSSAKIRDCILLPNPNSEAKKAANHHHTIMAKGNNAHKKEVKKPKKVKPKP